MIGNAEAFFIPDTPAQPIATHDVAGTMLSRNTSGGFSNSIDHAASGYMALQPIALQDIRAVEKKQNGRGWNDDGTAYTVDTHATQGVAQPIPLDMMNIRGRPSDDGRANRIGRGYGEVGDPMFTITKANHHGVAQPITQFGNIAGTLTKRYDSSACADRGQNVLAQPIAFSGQMSNPQTDVDMTQTLQAKNPMAVVAPTLTAANDPSRSPQSSEVTQQVYSVLQASMAVRRLTPKECERLQGFPDNYTDIKPKGKATPDGPRYKALGNSMAVPVMAWIGKRIQEVDAICQTQKQ